MGKVKRSKLRTPDFSLVFASTRDGFLMGSEGSNKHITFISKDGKLSVHETSNLPGGVGKRRNILPTSDQSIVASYLVDVLRPYLTAENVYAGQEFLIPRREFLERFLPPPEVVKGTSVTTLGPLVDMLKHAKEGKYTLHEMFERINHDELVKRNIHEAYTPEFKSLLVFNGVAFFVDYQEFTEKMMKSKLAEALGAKSLVDEKKKSMTQP